jgi:hypothetical protein
MTSGIIKRRRESSLSISEVMNSLTHVSVQKRALIALRQGQVGQVRQRPKKNGPLIYLI